MSSQIANGKRYLHDDGILVLKSSCRSLEFLMFEAPTRVALAASPENCTKLFTD